MRVRCGRCERSLATMRVYRRRGETYRPGSIAPTVHAWQRGRPVLCDECYRMLSPGKKSGYVAHDPRSARG